MSKKYTVLALVGTITALACYVRCTGERGGSATVRQTTSDHSARATATGGAQDQAEATLDVRLLDGNGQPLPGFVTMEMDPRSSLVDTRSVVAGPDGRCTLREVEPGAYVVTASAQGHLPATTRVTLEAGAHRDLTLDLAKGGARLFGAVQDVESGALGGAAILARQLSMHELDSGPVYATVAGDDGDYELFVPPGRYRIAVSFDGYAGTDRSTAVDEPSRREDFRLYPAAAIEGRVVSRADGQPGAHLLVIAQGADGGGSAAAAVTRSDDAGRFRLSGLRPGALMLSARGADHGTVAGTSVVVGIGETVTDVVLYTDAAYRLEGRVVSSRTGAPVEGVWVAASGAVDQSQVRASAATDAAGRFGIDGLVSARYAVYTEPGAAAATIASAIVEIVDQNAKIELALDTGLSIRGRVTPPGPATISLVASTESLRIDQLGTAFSAEARATAVADDHGSFVLEDVPPGTWEVVAQTGDSRGSTLVEVGDRDLDDVVIELSPQARLCGNVVDENGAPITSARVTLEPRRPASGPLEGSLRNLRLLGGRSGYPVDHAGHFCSEPLAAGDYFAFVRDRTGMLMPTPSQTDGGNLRPISLHGGLLDGYVLEVESPDGRISGRVVDAAGHPMPDVYVTAARNVKTTGGDLFPAASLSSAELPVITNPDGRFQISNLKPGPHSLLVDAPSTGAHGHYDSAFPGDDVTITLTPYGTIRGRATGARGACTVVLRGRVDRSTQGIGPDCAFELARLPAGEYTIAVATPSGTATKPATVRAGTATDVTLAFQAWASIRGRLVDQDGTPMAGHPVLASGNGIENAELSARLALGTIDRSAADGSFHIARITPGEVFFAVLPLHGVEPLRAEKLQLAAGEAMNRGLLEVSASADQ